MGERGRRASAVAVVAVVAAGVGTGVGMSITNKPTPDQTPRSQSRPETATAERRDLIATERLSGTLGFGPARPIVAPRSGRLTAHAPSGARIGRGDVLYEVDGTTVELFLGTRPFWRPLAVGVPDGPDVRQLEENLVALRIATSEQLTVDERYSMATADAVERWQRARGRTRTGALDPSDVAVHPTPLRVAELSVPLGGNVVAGAPVATVTSAVEVVTADVHASDLEVVAVGTTVSVELHDGMSLPGRVDSIVPQQEAPEQSAPGQPRFTAAISVDVPDERSIDRLPVDVRIEVTRAEGVLAVPVAALLARPGGFAVEVVTDRGKRRVVAVDLGLEADGFVEVRGALRSGDRVVVAPT